MKKWFLRLFVALMAFVFSVALTGAFRFLFGGGRTLDMAVVSDSPLDFNSDYSQIADIYRQYGPAQTRHDRAFFERIETDSFVLFSGQQRFTREEDIQLMERQPMGSSYEVRVRYIRVFGNLAVSRGHLLVTCGNGATFERPFIDVWVKRGDTWLIQSTTTACG